MYKRGRHSFWTSGEVLIWGSRSIGQHSTLVGAVYVCDVYVLVLMDGSIVRPTCVAGNAVRYALQGLGKEVVQESHGKYRIDADPMRLAHLGRWCLTSVFGAVSLLHVRKYEDLPQTFRCEVSRADDVLEADIVNLLRSFIFYVDTAFPGQRRLQVVVLYKVGNQGRRAYWNPRGLDQHLLMAILTIRSFQRHVRMGTIVATDTEIR